MVGWARISLQSMSIEIKGRRLEPLFPWGLHGQVGGLVLGLLSDVGNDPNRTCWGLWRRRGGRWGGLHPGEVVGGHWRWDLLRVGDHPERVNCLSSCCLSTMRILSTTTLMKRPRPRRTCLLLVLQLLRVFLAMATLTWCFSTPATWRGFSYVSFARRNCKSYVHVNAIGIKTKNVLPKA